MIVFFASLVAILYHLGIMQRVVRWVGGAIGWVTGVSRVESLGAAANIFVGQSESPLVVRPYLSALPPSHLFTLMSVGMAGVAGTILAAYAGLLGEKYLPYLLAAAFMSAPGGILMAKLIMPDEPAGPDELDAQRRRGRRARGRDRGPHLRGRRAPGQHHHGRRPGRADRRQAGGRGRRDGAGLRRPGRARQRHSWRRSAAGSAGPTCRSRQIVGTLFSPVMYLIGIPWNEAGVAGGLFGTKIVLNEFVAFIDLGNAAGPAAALSDRSRAIVTFALCGFANFSSIAIQMAVTGNLAPNQRPMIAKLGLRALLAGSLANLMSAALAGLMIG